MRVFYETKLQEVCNNFHFPHKVQVCGLSLQKKGKKRNNNLRSMKSRKVICFKIILVQLFLFAGNSSHIFQTILSTMVSYAT